MSTIRIGTAERRLGEATDHWVENEVKSQRKHNPNLCVMLTLHCNSINMTLSTPGCAGPGGGGRPPNAKERELFDEWNQRGLQMPDWQLHALVRFVNHVKHLC